MSIKLPSRSRSGGGATRPDFLSVLGSRSSGSDSDFVPTGDLEVDYENLKNRKLTAALKRGEIPGGSPEAKAKAETEALIERLAAAGEMPGGEEAAKEAVRLRAALGAGGAAAALQEDKANSITGKALKAGAPVLELLGRTSNATQEGIQTVVQATGADDLFSGAWRLNDDEKSTELSSAKQVEEAGGQALSPEAQAIVGEGSAGSGGFRDVIRAARGQERWDPTSLSYTKNLSFQNALGSDDSFNTGALGKVTDVANFTGTAALDPLNFVGGGASSAAKKAAGESAEMIARQGADAVLSAGLAKRLGQETAEGLTKEAIEQGILREGIRLGTTAEQKAALREALIAQADEGAARTTRGIVTDESKQAALKTDSLPDRFARAATGKGKRSGAERAAEKTIDSALRYDRGGLRVAGRSLPRQTGDARRALLGRTDEVGSKYAAEQVAAGAEAQAAVDLRKIESAARLEAGLKAQAALMGEGIAPEAAAQVASRAKGWGTRGLNLAADREEMLKAVDAGDTEALLNLNPALENIQAPVKDFVPGIIPTGKAREVGQTLKSLLVPRAGIEGSESLGADVAQAVRDSQITGLALTKQEHDLGARLLRRALTDAKKIDDTFKARVLEAMDLKGSVKELRKTIEAGTPEAAFLDNLETLRQHTFDLNEKYGLADVRKWDKDNYVKRKLAPGAQEALDTAVKKYPREFNQYAQFVSDAKGRAGQKGALKLRTKFKDKSIQEINAELGTALQQKGLLPEGKVYSEDIADLVSTRYNDTLPSLQLAQTADDMAKTLKSSVGTTLVERVRPGAADEAAKKASLAKRGMKPINLGEGGTIYAHPDIAPELEEYVRITGSTGGVAEVEKFLDGWMRLWKSYATVPLIGGTGFHVKNSIGNVFNNTLRGIGLPAYKEAFEGQNLIRKAKKAFPDDNIPEALLKIGVPEDKVARIELAIENQIVDEGFLNTDLGERAAAELKSTKRGVGATLKRKAGFDGVEHMLGVPSGRAVGQLVEDNARLAHFFHVLDETGDAATAAQSVRKYLFDYGDLTPFEKRGLKRVSAFYTFTRKNTPLQFRSLIDNPSAYTRANLAKNMVMGNGSEEGSPDFMDEIGTPLGRRQSGWLSGNGSQVIGNIETPFDAAAKATAPLQFLRPGGASFQEASQGVIGNWSGGVNELGKTFMDYASGSSAFSGSELKDQDGNYKASPVLRLTDSVVPAGGKLMRLTGNKSAGPNAENARIRIIKALTGIQAKEVTPKMREIAASQDLKTVEDVIDALKKAGVAVPTESELKQLGLLEED